MVHGDGLVADVTRCTPGEGTVRALDALSDSICCVVDAAELCRLTHPDPSWARAAEAAATTLHGYVAALNAHTGLYKAVCDALDTPALSREGRAVAASLRAEFERGGIALSSSGRERLKAAQAEALSCGFAYARALSGPSRSQPADAEEPLGDASRADALLLRLLASRAQAAALLGFPSYAHLATQPLLAGSPEQPEAFLAALSRGLRGRARAEARAFAGAPDGGPPRERDARMAAARDAACGAADRKAASAFFPLRNCVGGLLALTRSLFGITLTPAVLAAHEAWDPGVSAFDASHAGDGPLGRVYLDLGHRRGKPPGAAHFVIKAGFGGRGAAVALVARMGAGDDALSHSDVETLHHEWGHALHSLLSRTTYQARGLTRA